ncbi:MBL fold metallo-hydrolase [Paenibacillus macerans]|uniref:MBL fold metallo-hydrolase n=1 Tax=Paenibacillus macerans TaxID=44252 RepID=UPI003D3176AA
MKERSLLNTGLVDTVRVADDVWCVRTLIVNAVFVGDSFKGDWVLVDTGLAPFAEALIKEADSIFGRPPACVVLTHGHFDHVGNVSKLTELWDVPVYAHASEMPYLTGQRDYPEGDPSVGGGLMAEVAPAYPHRAIDLHDRVRPLPEGGLVPGLPEWRWIFTPGHSPGHISLFRERDRLLLAGDAVITVKQESALAVVAQTKEVHGPPMYFTPDWVKAGESVRALAALEPEAAVTGHGQPLFGEELRSGLRRLAERFEELAVPEQGKYVPQGLRS